MTRNFIKLPVAGYVNSWCSFERFTSYILPVRGQYTQYRLKSSQYQGQTDEGGGGWELGQFATGFGGPKGPFSPVAPKLEWKDWNPHPPPPPPYI